MLHCALRDEVNETARNMTSTNIEDALPEVVRSLRSVLNPERIYVFGSVARGTSDTASDVGLTVAVPDSGLDFFERGAAAYRALRDVDVPIDVQVYTRDEFDHRASLPVSIERPVQWEGKVLYAA